MEGETCACISREFIRSRYRLANGEVATYYYAWRGGPRIDAEPGTPEFLRLYTEAHAARKRPAHGTMHGADRRI